jgi:hypothetical protein
MYDYICFKNIGFFDRMASDDAETSLLAIKFYELL